MLAADHLHSRYAESVQLTEGQMQMANVQGIGRLRDLREAAALSPELAKTLGSADIAGVQMQALSRSFAKSFRPSEILMSNIKGVKQWATAFVRYPTVGGID